MLKWKVRKFCDNDDVCYCITNNIPRSLQNKVRFELRTAPFDTKKVAKKKSLDKRLHKIVGGDHRAAGTKDVIIISPSCLPFFNIQRRAIRKTQVRGMQARGCQFGSLLGLFFYLLF